MCACFYGCYCATKGMYHSCWDAMLWILSIPNFFNAIQTLSINQISSYGFHRLIFIIMHKIKIVFKLYITFILKEVNMYFFHFRVREQQCVVLSCNTVLRFFYLKLKISKTAGQNWFYSLGKHNKCLLVVLGYFLEPLALHWRRWEYQIVPEKVLERIPFRI